MGTPLPRAAAEKRRATRTRDALRNMIPSFFGNRWVASFERSESDGSRRATRGTARWNSGERRYQGMQRRSERLPCPNGQLEGAMRVGMLLVLFDLGLASI